jgi:hypothetical protein
MAKLPTRSGATRAAACGPHALLLEISLNFMVHIVLACAVLSAAACASPPPPPVAVDLSAPPRKPYDAKTQLESGRRY